LLPFPSSWMKAGESRGVRGAWPGRSVSACSSTSRWSWPASPASPWCPVSPFPVSATSCPPLRLLGSPHSMQTPCPRRPLIWEQPASRRAAMPGWPHQRSPERPPGHRSTPGPASRPEYSRPNNKDRALPAQPAWARVAPRRRRPRAPARSSAAATPRHRGCHGDRLRRRRRLLGFRATPGHKVGAPTMTPRRRLGEVEKAGSTPLERACC